MNNFANFNTLSLNYHEFKSAYTTRTIDKVKKKLYNTFNLLNNIKLILIMLLILSQETNINNSFQLFFSPNY